MLFLALLPITSFAANDLPIILSDDDANRYVEIFKLQNAGKFAEAKKLDREIEDPILMSAVLYERYMARGYTSTYRELADWMHEYSYAPGATNIYKMALKKGGANAKNATRAPKSTSGLINGRESEWAESESWTKKTYSGATGQNIKKFQNALRHGKTKNARDLLADKNFKKNLSAEDYGRLCGRLAFVYYADGYFDNAAEYGKISADAKSEYGLWTMGLMSFKSGEYDTAIEYFDGLTKLSHVNQARKIEGAFWAGRSSELAGKNSAASKYFEIGAEKPQLFYGALSAAMLGRTPEYTFYESGMTRRNVEELMKQPAGVRAMAFMQIGKPEYAEQHLRLIVTESASDALLNAIHALSEAAELPRLSLQMGRVMRDKGILDIDRDIIIAAQYPVPDWEPMHGWEVDRALLFAIAKQESQFKANAKSRAGATGIMQLMPKTAKLMAAKNNVKLNSLDLSKPEHNMFLGQKLVADLLDKSYIDNNLVKMLISYNSGAGTLLKWEKRFSTEDPLLFIESYPARETRDYTKRVLTNLWLYRARLGQPLTSITELANGQWPKYYAADDNMAARNAKESNAL